VTYRDLAVGTVDLGGRRLTTTRLRHPAPVSVIAWTTAGLDLLAWRARVRDLHPYLFHHDPDHTDAIIDAKPAQAREVLQARGATTVVRAPAEYAEIEVSPPPGAVAGASGC
jgi:hypothetical protein